MGSFRIVAKAAEIPEGKAKLIEIEGSMIAVFHTQSGWFAVDERCPHRGGPLSEGCVIQSKVQCPWHGSEFDLKSGECTNTPPRASLKTYPIRVTAEIVELEI